MPAPPPRRGPPAPPGPPPRRPPGAPALANQPPPLPTEELNPFVELPAPRSPALPAAHGPGSKGRPAASGPIIGVPNAALDSSPSSESNPFFAPPDAASAAEVVNPFLGASAPEPAPALETAPSPAAVPTPPRVAPLRVEPGVVAPQIKDPHAEFRRGGWKKPVLGGAAALALVGLFFLIPEAPDEKVGAAEVSAEATTVIGRSVAPEVIQDPNNPTLGASAAPEAAPAARAPEEPAPSPNRSDQSAHFADSFKASAQ